MHNKYSMPYNAPCPREAHIAEDMREAIKAEERQEEHRMIDRSRQQQFMIRGAEKDRLKREEMAFVAQWKVRTSYEQIPRSANKTLKRHCSHPAPCEPWTLGRRPWTLRPAPCALHPDASTLSPPET